MTEKLIHICGSPENYYYEEYVAPKHLKDIKIIKPDKPVSFKKLTQEDIFDLEDNHFIPAWTADKISKNIFTIDEWIIVREHNNSYIPSTLKQEDIYLIGKESPDSFPLIENIIIHAIAIISVILGFLILYPFL